MTMPDSLALLAKRLAEVDGPPPIIPARDRFTYLVDHDLGAPMESFTSLAEIEASLSASVSTREAARDFFVRFPGVTVVVMNPAAILNRLARLDEMSQVLTIVAHLEPGSPVPKVVVERIERISK